MNLNRTEENEVVVNSNTDAKVSKKLITFSKDLIVSRDSVSSIRKYQKTKIENYIEKTWHSKHFFSNRSFSINVIETIIILISSLLLLNLFNDKLGISGKFFIFNIFENILTSLDLPIIYIYGEIKNNINNSDISFILFIIIILIYFYLVDILFGIISSIKGVFYDLIIGPYEEKPAKRIVNDGWYVSIGLNSGEIILKKLSSESYMNEYIDQLSKLLEVHVDSKKYYIINDKGGVINSIGDTVHL